MALGAPRNPLTVGHCGNPGGLRHRLNPSLRGPRNDDRSGERSISVTLRETEIFRPSKAGAIVGSVHRGPCADKQRGKGRTAPPVPTTRVVPLIRCADLRCTQVIEARFALTGKVCLTAATAGSVGQWFIINEPRRDPNEVRS